jgi:hypothetical protein
MKALEELIMSHFAELITIMSLSWISLVVYGLVMS